MDARKAQAELKRLARLLPREKHRLQTAACLKVQGLIRRRIHNFGRATDGSEIGQYSQGYAEKRRTGLKIGGVIFKGLQTNYVDLEVTGDLRRAIMTGTLEGNVVLGVNEAELGKALKHERKYGEIYAPTTEEIKAGDEAIDLELSYIIEQILTNR